eukprot:2374600-Pleurochrysis_carterae.AAC.1
MGMGRGELEGARGRSEHGREEGAERPDERRVHSDRRRRRRAEAKRAKREARLRHTELARAEARGEWPRAEKERRAGSEQQRADRGAR